MAMAIRSSGEPASLDVLAFRVLEQEYCVAMRLVREIRGWSTYTSIPHSPPAVIGVINLRGAAVPIIDLAEKFGMRHQSQNDRSAIIVVEFDQSVVGLLVDKVSDILSVDRDVIQVLPKALTLQQTNLAEGVIASENGLMCLLNVERLLHFEPAAPGATHRAS